MYILSGAVAFSKTNISHQDIVTSAPDAASTSEDFNDSLVESRCSVLSREDYFTLSGKERFFAEHNCTPTSLGEEAVRGACEALGIPVEEIGMLIGDCSTPRQTIPAEGQRIAGKLGLKIPTFDILSPVIAPVLHLDLLSRWKKDQLPKYIALLYTNTPTVEVSSGSRFIFGDGAAALIVSREIVRGLEVEKTAVVQRSSSDLVFSVYSEAAADTLFQASDSALSALQSVSGGRQICFASPSRKLSDRVESLTSQPLLTGGVSQSGFALSTSTAATLVEALSFGTSFSMLATCGASYATATLRRV